MNEYEYILAEKAAEYISSGDFDSAEEIFKNYSGDLINKVYEPYINDMFYDLEFYRHYQNYDIYRHSVDEKNDRCLPYRKYSKLLKTFDENDKDKKLLICGKGALGDQIYYTRFLSIVLDITKNITVITLPRLVEHFTNAFPDVKFVEDDSQIEVSNFDCVLYMPLISKFAFTENNTPIKPLKPTAVTDLNKVETLRSLPQFKGKIIIGFSWKSARNDYRDDVDVGTSKSLMLRQLLPIFNIPNTSFINLQHKDHENDLEKFVEKYRLANIFTLEELDMNSSTKHIFDFVDMCDFIVSPINTLTIMAGALHKKTYTLVPNKKSAGRLIMYHSIPKDRRHVFFPTVKMYEQDQMFRWETAIELACNDLMSEINDA